MNTAISVFVSLCLMLVVGKVLRVNLPFLQRLYLPSSIIGGLVGLAVMCAAGEAVPGEFRAAMQKTPGFLINVIFATIFLGSAIPKVHDFVLFALPQFCMGQIIAWGQLAAVDHSRAGGCNLVGRLRPVPGAEALPLRLVRAVDRRVRTGDGRDGDGPYAGCCARSIRRTRRRRR